MEQKDFTIDKVGWHTQAPGNPDTPKEIYETFISFVLFLQKNNLLNKQLLTGDETVLDDEFCVKASDLTEEGMLLVKKSYSNWLRMLDRGGKPDNLRILEKGLKIIRQPK